MKKKYMIGCLVAILALAIIPITKSQAEESRTSTVIEHETGNMTVTLGDSTFEAVEKTVYQVTVDGEDFPVTQYKLPTVVEDGQNPNEADENYIEVLPVDIKAASEADIAAYGFSNEDGYDFQKEIWFGEEQFSVGLPSDGEFSYMYYTAVLPNQFSQDSEGKLVYIDDDDQAHELLLEEGNVVAHLQITLENGCEQFLTIHLDDIGNVQNALISYDDFVDF